MTKTKTTPGDSELTETLGATEYDRSEEATLFDDQPEAPVNEAEAKLRAVRLWGPWLLADAVATKAALHGVEFYLDSVCGPFNEDWTRRGFDLAKLDGTLRIFVRTLFKRAQDMPHKAAYLKALANSIRTAVKKENRADHAWRPNDILVAFASVSEDYSQDAGARLTERCVDLETSMGGLYRTPDGDARNDALDALEASLRHEKEKADREYAAWQAGRGF